MILALVAGCSTGAPTATTAPSSATNTEGTQTAAVAATTAPAAAGPAETVVIPFIKTMNPASETSMVQDAFNKFLKDKGYNINVQLVGIEFGNYGTQINLMMTDGSADLFNYGFTVALNQQVINGTIAPLDDLLNQYGQGIKTSLGDYLNCAKITGKIYAVPNMTAFANRLGYYIRQDVADAMKIDLTKTYDLQSLTDLMVQIQKAYPQYCLIPSGPKGTYIQQTYNCDLIGGTDQYPFGVLIDGAKDLKVVDYYESDQFKNLCAWGEKWKNQGLFLKDPQNAQDSSGAYIKGNLAAGMFAFSYDTKSAAITFSNTTGVKVTGVDVSPLLATTNDVTSFAWVIAANSKHKEASMQVLNEMYTDKDIANLVCSGIKDTHYVTNSDGTIQLKDGLTPQTVGWPSGMGTWWPNITITAPWAPFPANFYNSELQINSTAPGSAAMGFSFDPTNVANQITACSNVVDQYNYSLLLGIDVETNLPKFQQALKDAGIDQIIAEKQKQLDAWAASK
jgi:putative aldouronate transport system substrate-binding protein